MITVEGAVNNTNRSWAHIAERSRREPLPAPEDEQLAPPGEALGARTGPAARGLTA